MKELKQITIRVLDYKVTVNLSVKDSREKEAEKVYQKLKDGKSLDTEELMLLQKEDKL